ncbi:MAG: hypothetical protein J6W29_10035 [Neisseriaceae bacterium]|nr:hypothetical protein [Neisseriaceae bacterium]MBP5790553.1 hypothetical protein [Neisseriaceae bacterium]
MIKSSLIRLDYFVLDNTSILLSGCLKPFLALSLFVIDYPNKLLRPPAAFSQ